MRITVRRYRDDDAPAIDRFNDRMAAGGAPHRLFKEDLTQNPDADLDITPVHDSLFVAADGTEVRGGAWLREQYFLVGGERHRVAWIKYPVSESLVDPRFAGVPGSMVLQFLRIQPLLLALGMGGHGSPFARLLAGIGWRSHTVPLFFHPLRPSRVLKQLQYLRRRPRWRVAMDLAAWTGAGWIAHRLFEATGARPARRRRLTGQTVDDYGSWCDAVWEACSTSYPVLAVRNAHATGHLYPRDDPGLRRLRLSKDGDPVGWVTIQLLPATDRIMHYFGELRVAVVADALAPPNDALEVLAVTVEHMRTLDVDLMVGNFSHRSWTQGARRLRLLEGPSNFAFYLSPGLEDLFVSHDELASRCHFLRHTFGDDASLVATNT